MTAQSIALKTFVLLFLSALAGLLLGLPRGSVPKPTSSSPTSIKKVATPPKLPPRVAWTSSRIIGSPEPPLPYTIERAFPRLAFNSPLLMTMAPGSKRFFVGEQFGKIYSFPNEPKVERADLFVDLAKDLHGYDRAKFRAVDALYGLAFHPRYDENRYCYICYVLNDHKRSARVPDGTRVSRFRVIGTNPPRCDPHSEKVLITWQGGGHNGGCLKFGPDGYLYISTGDGSFPNPPDELHTGQDLSDLLSSILRIDVDHEEKGRAYKVPSDNPFVDLAGARPEIWSFGYRNPWKMSFDRQTGDLWVGDVGWELWEMVYRVKRGGNYGWSVMEGRQPVRPESQHGPTPILPPTIEFPHTEAASITGGFVYRGNEIADLQGYYICGDWATRKLWGTRFDGDKLLSHRVLAQGVQRVVAFGEDHDGELYFLHHDPVGTVHRLVPTPPVPPGQAPFPRRLSETGLFASTAEQKPAVGVVPFEINVPQWADHASSERFVALPGKLPVLFHEEMKDMPGSTFNGKAHFPKGGVLAKTITLEMDAGQAASRRRLETQILHFDGDNWHGYSYRWNAAQTDADLVEASGAEETVNVRDPKAPGGVRRQTWHYPSRDECLRCHNPWSGYGLAFTPSQLNIMNPHDGGSAPQLRRFEQLEIIRSGDKKKLAGWPRLHDPNNPAVGINERARSYLHVNCSHCHQFGAGGTADIELRSDYSIERTKMLEVRPAQGTFEIHGAQIVAPGDPYRSVLYYRMAKLGRGRMPHTGSEIVDRRGLQLMHDWIRQLPMHKDERALLARLRALDEPAVLARERREEPEQIRRRAADVARDAGRERASNEDRRQATKLVHEDYRQRAQHRAVERTETIRKLLATPTAAAMLAREFDHEQVPASIRPQVLQAAGKLTEMSIRDLFERFLPADQRVQRLGSVIRPEKLLALKGDAARGKKLFFDNSAMQCKACHRIHNVGGTLGPDLSLIGKKYVRSKLLETILEPSKEIEPKYTSYLVETTDGQVHTGLLAERNDKEVVLRDVRDQTIRIPAAKVSTLVPQRISIMPELQLRDLSAEQAADLLEYLSTLK